MEWAMGPGVCFAPALGDSDQRFWFVFLTDLVSNHEASISALRPAPLSQVALTSCRSRFVEFAQPLQERIFKHQPTEPS